MRNPNIAATIRKKEPQLDSVGEETSYANTTPKSPLPIAVKSTLPRPYLASDFADKRDSPTTYVSKHSSELDERDSSIARERKVEVHSPVKQGHVNVHTDLESVASAPTLPTRKGNSGFFKFNAPRSSNFVKGLGNRFSTKSTTSTQPKNHMEAVGAGELDKLEENAEPIVIQDDEQKITVDAVKYLLYGLQISSVDATDGDVQLHYRHFTDSNKIELKRDQIFMAPATFLEYSPKLFQKFRSMYGISETEYRNEMGNDGSREANIQCANNAYLSESKKCFYSSGGNYMIRIIDEEEADTLFRMLPLFFMYRKQSPETLLERFCGFYKINAEICGKSHEIHFLVSQSVYSNAFNLQKPLHSVYAISCSVDSNLYDKNAKNRGDMHDDIEQGNLKMEISAADTAAIKVQLENDFLFLTAWDIIGYELLVAVHDPLKSQGYRKTLAFDPRTYKFQERLTHMNTFAGGSTIDESGSVFPDDATARYSVLSTTKMSKVSVLHGKAKDTQYFFGIVGILRKHPWRFKMYSKIPSLWSSDPLISITRLNSRVPAEKLSPKDYAETLDRLFMKIWDSVPVN